MMLFLSKLLLFGGLTVLVAAFVLLRVYGKHGTKKIVAAGSLLAASTACGLVAGEVVVRIVFSDVSTTGDNTSFFAKRWQQKHPPSINSFGFREREFTVRPTHQTFRIAVVGDSFTYGQGVLTEQRLTNLLERRLNSAGDGAYEVLNFGIPGAETVDHTAILRESVLKVAPSYVLLQWFVNDVENDEMLRPRPWRLLPSDTLTGILHRYSALYYLVNQYWVNVQEKLGLVEGYQQYMIRHLKDPNSKNTLRARELLEEFFAVCRQYDIPVGVVLFPQLTKDLAQDYPLGFLLDRVLASCKQHNVPCVDLRDAFAVVESAAGLWVNRWDSHPGVLANQLATDAVIAVFGPIWEELRKKPGS